MYEINYTKEQKEIVDKLNASFAEKGIDYFVIQKARGVGASSMMEKYIVEKMLYTTPFNVLLICKDKSIFNAIKKGMYNFSAKVTSDEYGKINLANGNNLLWKQEWHNFKNGGNAFDLIYDDNEEDRSDKPGLLNSYIQLMSTNGNVVLTDGIDTKRTYNKQMNVLEMKKKIKAKSKVIEITESKEEPVEEESDGFTIDWENMAAILDEIERNISNWSATPTILMHFKNIIGNIRKKTEYYAENLPDTFLEKLDTLFELCDEIYEKLTNNNDPGAMAKSISDNLRRNADNVENTLFRMTKVLEASDKMDKDKPEIKEKAKEHMEECVKELDDEMKKWEVSDDVLKENLKYTMELIGKEYAENNTPKNWFEERQKSLDKEIDEAKAKLENDEKIKEVTNDMYEKLIEETREKLESERNPDGTRKHSDQEITGRISMLRKAQKDAWERKDYPCERAKGMFAKRNHFIAYLPLFNDKRNYGAMVEHISFDCKAKMLSISMNEYENDMYYPELIGYWMDILNGEKKAIDISVDYTNAFGKILYTQTFTNCILDYVGDGDLSVNDDGHIVYCLIYRFGKVMFNENPTEQKNRKLAVSVIPDGDKRQDQSKLINSRAFERAQELCSKEGQKIVDCLAKGKGFAGNKTTYSELKKENKCDNQWRNRFQ